ncbi:MAG: hypothetical protein M1822_006198 [Bathelium mastoideum]|nr:MAG: hypothetical protein M1822_006198 [Bathelium mastoideum]
MSNIPQTKSYNDERTPLLAQTNHQEHLDRYDQDGPALERVVSPDPTDVVDGGLAVQPISEATQSKTSLHNHQNGEGPGENGEPSGEHKRKNPYMGGVSVAQFWVAFVAICLQILLTNFDSTLMASSHPVITSYFNASNAAAWLSTAFLLTSTAFQPLFGRISDTIGRKWLHMVFMFIFGLGTAGCALAPTIGAFIAARAVAGLAAGCITSTGSIMINDMVPIEIRGVYQSYINMFFGAGSAAGAAFGGFMCDRLGWRWTFGIQIPIVVIVMILSAISIPAGLGPHLARNSNKTAWQLVAGFDITGSILLIVTVGFLILGLNVGGAILPWSHPLVIASLVLALVCIPLLAYAERRAERAVMPLWILSKPPHGNLVLSNFFAMIGINTIIFNAPLYFQAVLLDTPSMSGFRLTAPWIAATVCGVSAGFIITATGRMKPLLVVGSISMVIGAVLLTAMWPSIPSWLATAFLVPPSIGQGFAFPATMLAVLATCEQSEQAVVTSTLILSRSLGTVIGVAVSSLIVQNALWRFLEQNVTGEGKEKVIRLVRESVEAIKDLRGHHQEEAIHAYRQTLTLTFGFAIIIFLVVVGLLVFIRLPRLGRRKEGK